MKILIHTIKSPFTGEKVGGAETSLHLIAEELVKKGHNVTYLTRSNRKFFSADRIDEVNGIRVIHYPEVTPVKLANQGIVPGFILQFINGTFMHFTLKFIKLQSYDIVHAFYEVPFLEKVIKLRKKHGYNYRIVMRMAGMYWYDDITKNSSQKKVYEYIFNEVDSINYISAGLKKMTKQSVEKLDLKFQPEYTFTGDIGVKLDENLPEWKSDQNPDEVFKIIVATRFSDYQKRQDILVEAIKRVDNQLQFKVIMIGEGKNKEKIRRLIDKYSLNDVIELLDFQPQKKLWDMMAESDLLCHPTDDEGLGKIIIESMAMGLPVLTSDVPPLNNYIDDGRNGFLVENRPKAWKEKLEHIIENRNELEQISSNESEYARNKYDSKRNIDMYEREFLKLLGE